MNEKQTELPFDRRELNRLIEGADLPSPHRKTIRAVLKEIVFFHGRRDYPGYGPSHGYLADKIACSTRSIIRAVRDAETLGVLAIEPLTGSDGRKANKYTLNRPALGGYGNASDLSWDGCHSVTGQVTPCHRTGDTVSPDTCHGVTAYKEETNKTTKTRNDQRESAAAADPRLAEVIAWWNGLRDAGLIAAGVAADRPAEAVVKAWGRVQQSPGLRELFSDLPSIERSIVQSGFLHRASWFTLVKLLVGKNREGEPVVSKLLNGAYQDSLKGGTRHVRTDPSHVHPDDAHNTW